MSQIPSAAEDINPISYRDLLRVLLEKAWLILLIVVVAVFGGLYWIRTSPEQFRSVASLQVEDPQLVIQIQDVDSRNLQSDRTIATIMAATRLPSFLERVVRRGRLHEDPGFMPPRPDGSVPTVPQAVGLLRSSLSIYRQGETMLIDIAIEHHNPATARKVTNLIAKEVVLAEIEKSTGTTRSALEFLKREAEQARAKLLEMEKDLQKYREEHNATSLDDRQDTVTTKLRDASERLNAAKAETMRLTQDLRQIEQAGGDLDAMLLVPSVANDPNVAKVRSNIAAQELEIVRLKERYKHLHPKMIEANQALAKLKQTLREEVSKAPELLRRELDNLRAKEISFEIAAEEADKNALELGRVSIVYGDMERQVEAQRAIYEGLLNRMKGVDVAKGKDEVRISLAQPAQPAYQTKPDKPKILIASLMLGMVAGCGLAFALHFMDQSIKTMDEAEAHFRLPVLAAIPLSPSIRAQKHALFAYHNTDSALAECFRSLRASIQISMRELQAKSMLITSSLPGEGKSFCSTNIAAFFARQGMRTLIIDSDFRRPTLASKLRLDPEKPGLADILMGEALVEQAMLPTEVENLTAITSGTRSTRPAELLGSAELSGFLKAVIAYFDRVIIDSAPLLAVSDSLLIADKVDTVCLVMKAASTSRYAVDRAMRVLETANVQPCGLILNQVPVRSRLGYYNYYRYHTYDYGNSYRRYRTGSSNDQ